MINNLETLFRNALHCPQPRFGWAISWYLSHQLTARYYNSIGLYCSVYVRDDLSNDLISVKKMTCSSRISYGGLEVGHLVKNKEIHHFALGSNYDDKPLLVSCAVDDVSNGELITRAAVKKLALQMYSAKGHEWCGHARYADEFRLVWEVATILALEADAGVGGETPALLVNNDMLTREIPSEISKYRSPGVPDLFMFRGAVSVFVNARGEICDGSGDSLWAMYLEGLDSYSIACWLRARLSVGTV